MGLIAIISILLHIIKPLSANSINPKHLSSTSLYAVCKVKPVGTFQGSGGRESCSLSTASSGQAGLQKKSRFRDLGPRV